jgi:tRNA A-37 threonylcarbamoyl transferase component Bud32
MLSVAESSLVRRDLTLTGLASALDSDALIPLLQNARPDLDTLELTKSYIQYKPYTSCLVRYSARGPAGPEDLFVKVDSVESQTRLLKARDRTVALQNQLKAEKCLVFDPDRLMLCFFPYDTGLKQVWRLTDSRHRARMLSSILSIPAEKLTGDVQLLAYKPEQRLVIRVSPVDEPSSLIKFYTPRGYMNSVRAAAALRCADREQPLPNYTFSNETCSIASPWIRGTEYSQLVSLQAQYTGTTKKLGRRLAALHSTSLAIPSIRSVPAETWVNLHELADFVSHLLPHLRQRSQILAVKLDHALRQLPPERVLIHGNFHAEQVIVSAGEVHFIDFDSARFGHPAEDIGLFLAYLERDILGNRVSASNVDGLRQNLLQGYVEKSGHIPAFIDLFIVYGLFQLVHHPFQNCEPNWPQKMELLLSICESRLESL